MLVTGYPWYAIAAPAHRRWVEAFRQRTSAEPRLGALVGYITVLSIAEALRRAGPDLDADRLSAAFRGLAVETPIGPITFPRRGRAVDDGRLGGDDEARSRAGGRRHGGLRVRAGRGGTAAGGRDLEDAGGALASLRVRLLLLVSSSRDSPTRWSSS